jgi:DNA-binding GntR family transcriptional regulator
MIKPEIIVREFLPGGQAPTGTDLCETHQVSPITARQAMLNLAPVN